MKQLIALIRKQKGTFQEVRWEPAKPGLRQRIKEFVAFDLRSYFKSIWIGRLLIVFAFNTDDGFYLTHLSVGWYDENQEVPELAHTFIDYWS